MFVLQSTQQLKLKRNVSINSILVVLFLAIFVFLADSNEMFAKKTHHKSARKSKISTQQLEQIKLERIQKLYDFFPLYESWEKSEVYPYNDFIFLNNYDRSSIYEDFQKRKLLIEHLNDWMGVRYRCPGRSRQGVDCSNFVSIITKEVLGIDIPAGASTQATLYTKIENMNDLQFGDYVFFSGRNKRAKRIGHVGIYIGNGLFAHSSTGRGVIYTNISEGYYTDRYRFGGRMSKPEIAQLTRR